MTEIEQLEQALKTNKVIVSFLESRLELYREKESRLTMKLNRARRLERETQPITCSKEA